MCGTCLIDHIIDNRHQPEQHDEMNHDDYQPVESIDTNLPIDEYDFIVKSTANNQSNQTKSNQKSDSHHQVDDEQEHQDNAADDDINNDDTIAIDDDYQPAAQRKKQTKTNDSSTGRNKPNMKLTNKHTTKKLYSTSNKRVSTSIFDDTYGVNDDVTYNNESIYTDNNDDEDDNVLGGLEQMLAQARVCYYNVLLVTIAHCI